MKKIFLFILCIFSFVILFGCDSSVDYSNVKVNINTNDNILVWDKVENGSSYTILIDDVVVDTIYITSYELKLKAGTYQIQVQTKMKDGNVVLSNIITYETDGKYEDFDAIQLSAPLIHLNDNVLIWEAVKNADNYDVYANKELVTNTTKTTYTFNFEEKTYEIYVIAKSDDKYYTTSEPSNKVYHTYHSSANGTGSVNLFEINDTHGAFATDEDYAGLDKVQTVIEDLEKKDDHILIANGDLFQGGYCSNVTYGRCIVDALNVMNFDCFVIGNHEFDWGIEKLADYKDGDLSNGELDCPFLSCNIVYKDTKDTLSWADPYTIVESNGLRVGIIGAIGEGLTSSISADKTEDYLFLDPVPIASQLASELRLDFDCDMVVFAIHDYDTSTNERIAALSGDSRIDAIVCAHTHQYKEEYETRNDGYRIPVIQSNTKNISVGTMTLNIKDGVMQSSSMTHYTPSNYASSKTMDAVIAKYQSIINEGNAVVCNLTSSMNKSSLGVFACDSFMSMTNADFGCMNTGGVRDTLGRGNVTTKDVYSVFPFDNRIYIVKITGSKLKDLYDGGGLYFSSNFNSSSISSSKVYNLAVIDYVYLGSYYQKYYFGNVETTITDIYIRDAVLWGLKGR